jgi:hypothetical protein
MPKRGKMAFIWFTIRICSVTRFCRSRFGRPAPSSSIPMLQRRFSRRSRLKGAHQEFGIEAIGLCTPMFARYRDARGVNDINLDSAYLQPRNTSSAPLKPNHRMLTHARSTSRIAPTVQTPKIRDYCSAQGSAPAICHPR